MTSTDQTVRNSKHPVVAIAGATGAVGVELMQCLEQRKFPLVELRLLASARSAGKSMKFRGDDLKVQDLTDASLEGVAIAVVSAGGAPSGTPGYSAGTHHVNLLAFRWLLGRRCSGRFERVQLRGLFCRH